MVQVAGLPLLFVPIILVSYIGLPAEKSNDIAGLVSFMRNIGSSIGTSMVTTLLARYAQFHQVHLVGAHGTGRAGLHRHGIGADRAPDRRPVRRRRRRRVRPTASCIRR